MDSTLNPNVRRWIDIGRKRLQSVLWSHTIANHRTLENKISDAGPNNMRVQPHLLTDARKELETEGRILLSIRDDTHWYYLSDANRSEVESRLREQAEVYRQINRSAMSKLIGQAIEITVFRSLKAQTALQVYGGFYDLDEHDDSSPYSKDEPPSVVSGRTMPGRKKLDFLLYRQDIGHVGVEVKNARQWLYPNRHEVRELIQKCCAIDAVPVIIARRIPYVSFTELFEPCGVLVHETYNQRYPISHEKLANKAKDKKLFGYHDIRLGNEPDDRLNLFLHKTLPSLLHAGREKFDKHKDLLRRFGNSSSTYKEFQLERRTRAS